MEVSGEEVFRMMQENFLAVVLTSYVIAKVTSIPYKGMIGNNYIYS